MAVQPLNFLKNLFGRKQYREQRRETETGRGEGKDKDKDRERERVHDRNISKEKLISKSA
jgi:hypothetical protein